MVICGTGHRPDKFSWYDRKRTDAENEKSKECQWIKTQLNKVVEKLISDNTTEEPITFISGMALGFDTWLAECVIGRRCSNIMLEAAIPCFGQESLWPQQAQDRYCRIVDQCDIRTVVSKDKYKPYYMIKRNEYMVDKSDIVIACYDGTPGGTRRTVLYAMDKGKKIIIIDPIRHEIRTIEN